MRISNLTWSIDESDIPEESRKTALKAFQNPSVIRFSTFVPELNKVLTVERKKEVINPLNLV